MVALEPCLYLVPSQHASLQLHLYQACQKLTGLLAFTMSRLPFCGQVASLIGAESAVAFDLTAACSGRAPVTLSLSLSLSIINLCAVRTRYVFWVYTARLFVWQHCRKAATLPCVWSANLLLKPCKSVFQAKIVCERCSKTVSSCTVAASSSKKCALCTNMN